MIGYKNLIISKIFLTIYVMSIVAFGDQVRYVKISTVIGISTFLVFIVEFLLTCSKKRISKEFTTTKPLIFTSSFILFVCISGLIDSSSNQRIITISQLLILFSIIYYTVRITGETWFLHWGFMAGIAITYILSSDQLSQAAISGKRGALSLDGISGEGMNINRYAQYLNIYLILAAKEYLISDYNFGRLKLITSRLIILFFSGFCIYQIITITGSRKGLVAMLLIASSSLLIYTKGRIEPLRLIVITFAAIFIYFVSGILLSKSNFGERYATILQPRTTLTDSSINERTEMMKVGIELWIDKPIFGQGVDGFSKLSGYGTYSHSNYIEMLCNHGLIGITTYYSTHFIIIYLSFTLYLTAPRNSRGHIIWVLSSTILLITWDIAAVSWLNKANYLILAMSLGYVFFISDSIRKRRIKDSKSKSRPICHTPIAGRFIE